MATARDDLLEGRRALEAAEWQAAHEAFTRVLEAGDSADAHEERRAERAEHGYGKRSATREPRWHNR